MPPSSTPCGSSGWSRPSTALPDTPGFTSSGRASRISFRALCPTPYNGVLDLEKTLLHKVGEAVTRFKMIREGDRVAVGLSGGKDSVTLLEALILLAERAPIDFSVCAFTVEQGKFLRPIEPMGEYLKERGVAWTYYSDGASLTLPDAH